MSQENTVTKNEEQDRYEITVDGEVAGFITYRQGDGYLDLVHTEVKDNYEGQGLASQLTKGAVSDVVSAGEKVEASCPYVAKWFQKHPEFQEHLTN